MKQTTIFLLVLLSFWMGCKKASEGPKAPTLADANNLFAQGNYTEALNLFTQLIAQEGSTARVGAGWCELRLSDFSQAVTYFTDAGGDSLVDGYAGWSFASWAINNPQQAIDRANFVLASDPAFTLSLDPRVTADHLIWIQASCYLQLQNYSACLERIQQLDALYTVNLNDPNIEDLLLAKLESLGTITL